MSNTLKKVFTLVHKDKEVDMVKFCEVLNLSPSTWYNYRPFILSKFPSIIFEDNKLKWVED